MPYININLHYMAGIQAIWIHERKYFNIKIGKLNQVVMELITEM